MTGGQNWQALSTRKIAGPRAKVKGRDEGRGQSASPLPGSLGRGTLYLTKLTLLQFYLRCRKQNSNKSEQRK